MPMEQTDMGANHLSRSGFYLLSLHPNQQNSVITGQPTHFPVLNQY